MSDFINKKPTLPTDEDKIETLLEKLNLSNNYLDEVRIKLIDKCNELGKKIK